MNLYIVADGGGFEFGADRVTPLTWAIKRKTFRHVYTQYKLTVEQAAKAECLFHNRPLVVLSYNHMVLELCKD